MKKIKKLLVLMMSVIIITVFMPAVALAADNTTPVYLAFTSDIHYPQVNNPSDGMTSVKRLETWLNNATSSSGISAFETMGVTGDLASSHNNNDAYWDNAQVGVSVIENSNKVNDNGIYIAGNHEHQNGQLSSSTHATAKKIKAVGANLTVAGRVDIYCFGAASQTQGFNSTDINNLDAYLAQSHNGKPIIIMSHYPLHSYGGRSSSNADSVISTINKYADKEAVVFLWGHVHSVNDPNYDKIITDSIGSTAIKFTYAAAGCMCDDEYDNGSSNHNIKGKGLVVKVNDSTIDFKYYNASGTVVGESKTVSTDKSDTPDVPQTVSVTGVGLDKSSAELTAGNSVKLTATVQPSNATNKNVTWSSGNTGIATVDTNGNVTGVAAGTTTITVKTADGNKTASCTVKVNASTPQTIPVTGVGLDKSSAELTAGNSVKLTATVQPSNATNKNVTWSSGNTGIATVDANGNVKGVAAGTTTITVKTADGNKTASCTVKVNASTPQTVPVTGVGLDKPSAELNVGNSVKLTATIQPSNATNKNVTWSSGNTGIATVDTNGKVTGVAAGTTKITVKTVDGNKTASCTVTVNADPTPVPVPIPDPDPVPVPPHDHIYNNKVVDIASGYLKNGIGHYECSCGEHGSSYVIAGYSTYYVKSFKVSKGSKCFTAKWKKQSKKTQKKFTGYQIRYSTKSTMEGCKYATAKKSASSKKIKKLKMKTKYYVQVRTYRTVGGVKYFSKWSGAKSVKTK